MLKKNFAGFLGLLCAAFMFTATLSSIGCGDGAADAPTETSTDDIDHSDDEDGHAGGEEEGGSGMMDSMKDGAKGAMDSMKDGVKDAGGAVMDKAKEAGGAVMDKAKEAGGAVMDKAKEAVGK